MLRAFIAFYLCLRIWAKTTTAVKKERRSFRTVVNLAEGEEEEVIFKIERVEESIRNDNHLCLDAVTYAGSLTIS